MRWFHRKRKRGKCPVCGARAVRDDRCGQCHAYKSGIDGRWYAARLPRRLREKRWSREATCGNIGYEKRFA